MCQQSLSPDYQLSMRRTGVSSRTLSRQKRTFLHEIAELKKNRKVCEIHQKPKKETGEGFHFITVYLCDAHASVQLNKKKNKIQCRSQKENVGFFGVPLEW